MKPVRIQMKRVKGFNLQKVSKKTNGLLAVLVTRPGKWGNPFKEGELRWTVKRVHKIIDRKEAVELYTDIVKKGIMSEVIKKELKGKNLACFCKIGEPCHADILLDIANKK